MIKGLFRGLSVPDRPAASPPRRYEDIDTWGDEARFEAVRWHVLILSVIVLASVVLIVVGDSSLRAVAIMGVLFFGGVLVASSVGLRNTVRRMRAGRGLVPGDPYRLEGIDPAEVAAEPTARRGRAAGGLGHRHLCDGSPLG